MICLSSIKTSPSPRTFQDEVLEAARKAKDAGSTRFCMGTAWRGVGQKNSFHHILTMVKEASGMLTWEKYGYPLVI
jgi:biotin synthase